MEFPLPAPLGYQYTYQLLSSEILANAAILYIHVTPEQSRTKNKERGMELPGNVASSIGAQIMHSLNHSVPEFVMWNAYGRDDIFDLVRECNIPNAIKASISLFIICTHTQKSSLRRIQIMRRMSVYYLPIAVFNNADKDLTSFCRKNTAEWKEEEKAELHAELTRSFKGLLEQYMRLNGPDDG